MSWNKNRLKRTRIHRLDKARDAVRSVVHQVQIEQELTIVDVLWLLAEVTREWAASAMSATVDELLREGQE